MRIMSAVVAAAAAVTAVVDKPVAYTVGNAGLEAVLSVHLAVSQCVKQANKTEIKHVQQE